MEKLSLREVRDLHNLTQPGSCRARPPTPICLMRKPLLKVVIQYFLCSFMLISPYFPDQSIQTGNEDLTFLNLSFLLGAHPIGFGKDPVSCCVEACSHSAWPPICSGSGSEWE